MPAFTDLEPEDYRVGPVVERRKHPRMQRVYRIKMDGVLHCWLESQWSPLPDSDDWIEWVRN